MGARRWHLRATADLVNISAVSPDGPNEKYKALQASGVVLSLLKLEDGGLAAGTDASTVDLFNFSAVSPDGLDEKYKTFQASGDVLLLLKT